MEHKSTPPYYEASNQRFAWPAIRPVIIEDTIFVWGAYGTSELHGIMKIEEFPVWLIEHKEKVNWDIEKRNKKREEVKSEIPVDFSLDDFEI